MKRSPLVYATLALMLFGAAPVCAAPSVLADDAPPPYMIHVNDRDGEKDKSLSGLWEKHGGKDKTERREKWEAERKKIEAMSEDEQAAYLREKAEKHRARMMEHIEGLPPEKQEEARAKMEEMEARKREMREELMALPPEERKARMKELREEYHAKRAEKMKEKFQARWDGASAEDKAAFCEKTAAHCAAREGDDRGHHLCERAATACATLE